MLITYASNIPFNNVLKADTRNQSHNGAADMDNG